MSLEHPPLKTFFLELLERSRARQGEPPQLEVDHYLAEMLIRYVEPSAMLLEYLERPLLLEAYKAPSEGMPKLGVVAETLLFLLGCYTERLSRSGVELDTFVASAKGAYGIMSSHVQRHHPYAKAYRVCAHGIERVARLLNDMSDEWIRCEEADLLRLIQRYAVFHSSRDLEVLIAHNVLCVEDGKRIVYKN